MRARGGVRERVRERERERGGPGGERGREREREGGERGGGRDRERERGGEREGGTGREQIPKTKHLKVEHTTNMVKLRDELEKLIAWKRWGRRSVPKNLRLQSQFFEESVDLYSVSQPWTLAGGLFHIAAGACGRTGKAFDPT